MSATILKRSFILDKAGKKSELADPNPDFTPEEVLKYYSVMHPELTNSSVFGPEVKENKLEFSFKTSVGTKG